MQALDITAFGWPEGVRHLNGGVPRTARDTAVHFHQVLSEFIFFTGALTRKFSIRWSLKFPPHLKRVATLRCEILKHTTSTLSQTRGSFT